MKNSDTEGRSEKVIRWIARGIGSLVAGFWLFAGIASGIVESGPLTVESGIMAGLITASAVGVLIAWWREGIGGIVVMACAVAHAIFAYVASGHNKGLAIAISGGPFSLVGALFLASWWRSRRWHAEEETSTLSPQTPGDSQTPM
jgi:hypothetical protein